MPIAYDASKQALYSPEERATVFAAGASYPPIALAVEASRLAYLRWETSAQALERLQAALACCGFGAPVTFIDDTVGAQAFGCICAQDGTAMLAFRGTQPDQLRDLLSDLEANTVPWTESAGMVHAGFARATRALSVQISDWMQANQVQPERLICTGHSLGAAMATLAASLWRPAHLITIGSPRVGDAKFVNTLAGIAIARIVDCCDIVTELPPSLGIYTHAGAAIYITSNGSLLTDPDAALIAADRHQARLDYTLSQAWRSAAVLSRDLADHAPINYVRAYFP